MTLEKILSDFKKIVSVDAFSGGRDGKVFFLSHYHSDHRPGLYEGWNKGQIVCSDLTGKFLRKLCKINGESVLTADENCWYDCFSDFEFCTHDANHCPGAYMFLFKYKHKKILHTGDFRLNKSIEKWLIQNKPYDYVIADDTYYSAKGIYDFPSQESCIKKAVRIACANKDKEIFIGIYTLGKEKLLCAVSEALSCPIYVPDKMRKCFKIQDLKYITSDKKITNIYAYGMGYFSSEWFFFNPDNHVVIIPTGWQGTFSHNDHYHYIPYSEHCSSNEFKRFLDIVLPAYVYGHVSKLMLAR